MRLFWAPTSPYVRKVMVVAHEAGVAGRLEQIETTPEKVVAEVGPVNPLAQIPALEIAPGEWLYESLAIAEYLDNLGGGDVFPAPGAARWAALRRHALGQGVIDLGNQEVNMARLPAAERSPTLRAKRRAALARALDALEREAPALATERPTIGEIAIGCGLFYLDFRFPDDPWRPGRTALAEWAEAIAERQSFRKTQPPQ